MNFARVAAAAERARGVQGAIMKTRRAFPALPHPQWSPRIGRFGTTWFPNSDKTHPRPGICYDAFSRRHGRPHPCKP